MAACPNGSASLFMGAKITHLGELPQGQPERDSRVVDMVAQHDHEGFGGCTNIGECTAACPKEIPLDVISRLNWDLHQAMRHGPLSHLKAGPSEISGGPVLILRVLDQQHGRARGVPHIAQNDAANGHPWRSIRR